MTEVTYLPNQSFIKDGKTIAVLALDNIDEKLIEFSSWHFEKEVVDDVDDGYFTILAVRTELFEISDATFKLQIHCEDLKDIHVTREYGNEYGTCVKFKGYGDGPYYVIPGFEDSHAAGRLQTWLYNLYFEHGKKK